MTAKRIDIADLSVVLIDAQPFFIEEAFGDQTGAREALLVRLEHLLMLSEWADLPVVATSERPVADKGRLPGRLEAVFPSTGVAYEKSTFDCTAEPQIRAAIDQTGRKQIAVAGAETDVCVLQSVLGLIDMGLDVFVIEDCIFSTEANGEPAFARMYQAGAVPVTLKTLAYELVENVNDIPWTTESRRTIPNPIASAFQPPELWPPTLDS